LKQWLKKVREFSDDHVQVALVGNKADLVGNLKVSESKGTIFEENKDGSRPVKRHKTMFTELINQNETYMEPT
jgi:hypothetical protein